MKKALETLGLVLLAVGAAGVVHHFLGWFRLWAVVRLLPFLDGHELLYANIALAVLGFVLMAAPEEISKRSRRPLTADADRGPRA